MTFLALVLSALISDPVSGPRVAPGSPHTAVTAEGTVVVWNERDWTAASLVDGDGRVIRIFKPVRRQQGLPLFPGRIGGGADRVLVPGECTSSAGARSVCITRIDVRAGTIGDAEVVEEDAVSPSVAWNGQSFLMTYIRRPLSDRVVVGRLISPDGLPGPVIEIGRWNPFSHAPSVAASAGAFLVAWTEGSAGTLAEIVDGSVRRRIDLEVPAGEAGAHLSVVAAADEVMVVNGKGSSRRYRDLIAAGPWTSLGIPSLFVFHPRAVRVDGDWWIVFVHQTGNGYEIKRASLGSEEKTALRVTIDFFQSFDTAVHPDGFLLAWSRRHSAKDAVPFESDIAFRTFSAIGPRHDPAIASMGVASQAAPAAASGDGVLLTAWNERNGETWRVRARALTSGPVIELPPSALDQTHPAVAYGRDSFLIVWSEGPAGRSAIRGARIAANGFVLDPAGFEISSHAPLMQPSNGTITQRTASVAWNGTNWIVASEERDGIGLRRISPSGVVLDSTPLLLPRRGEVERWPDLDCSADGTCLVAWQTYVVPYCTVACTSALDSVAAARVAANLQILDPTPLLVAGPDRGTPAEWRNLGVVWNPKQQAWMVAWAGPSGRRVSADGSFLDAAQGSAVWNRPFTSIAASGDGWRVLWSGTTAEHRGVVTAWTSTGFSRATLRQETVVAGPSQEDREVFLAAGGEYALYVQSAPELDGAHRVFVQRLGPPGTGLARRRSVGRTP